MKTLKHLKWIWLLLWLSDIIHAETNLLPPPGNYQSEYVCFDYPMVFEDGTLTVAEKSVILKDYTMIWKNYPQTGVNFNNLGTLSLPDGTEVQLNCRIFSFKDSIADPLYQEIIGTLGVINGFGYVIPISTILSDIYRTKMQLPDFDGAYAALDGFVHTMNHLEETNLKTIGDILAIYGEVAADVANRDIRYYAENNKNTQYRPTSVINFSVGENDDLVGQFIASMGVKQEDSIYMSQWITWPIVYVNNRWKMYASTEW